MPSPLASAFPHPGPRSSPSRRDWLRTAGGGLGGLALAALEVDAAAAAGNAAGALVHPPRAKRVVQLFMAGAASHIDLFDYKPELVARHGQESDFGEPVEAFQNGLGPWLKPVWPFTPHGRCGKPLEIGRAHV